MYAIYTCLGGARSYESIFLVLLAPRMGLTSSTQAPSPSILVEAPPPATTVAAALHATNTRGDEVAAALGTTMASSALNAPLLAGTDNTAQAHADTIKPGAVNHEAQSTTAKSTFYIVSYPSWSDVGPNPYRPDDLEDWIFKNSSGCQSIFYNENAAREAVCRWNASLEQPSSDPRKQRHPASMLVYNSAFL